jgi:hypothetical protein
MTSKGNTLIQHITQGVQKLKLSFQTNGGSRRPLISRLNYMTFPCGFSIASSMASGRTIPTYTKLPTHFRATLTFRMASALHVVFPSPREMSSPLLRGS